MLYITRPMTDNRDRKESAMRNKQISITVTDDFEQALKAEAGKSHFGSFSQFCNYLMEIGLEAYKKSKSNNGKSIPDNIDVSAIVKEIAANEDLVKLLKRAIKNNDH